MDKLKSYLYDKKQQVRVFMKVCGSLRETMGSCHGIIGRALLEHRNRPLWLRSSTRLAQ